MDPRTPHLSSIWLRFVIVVLFSVVAGHAAMLPDPSLLPACTMGEMLPTSNMPNVPFLKLQTQALDLQFGQSHRACMSGRARIFWHQNQIETQHMCLERSDVGRMRRIKASRGLVLKAPNLLVRGDTMTLIHRDPEHVRMHVEGARVAFKSQNHPPIWHAKAAVFQMQGQSIWTLLDATLSTCAWPKPAWALKSAQVLVNTHRCEMTLVHPYWSLGSWARFPMPTMHLPIGTKGHNGLLTPIIKTSDYMGFQLQVPWYFKWAPQQDFKWFLGGTVKTGASLGAHFRWLTRWGLFQWRGFHVFHDRAWANYKNNLWQTWSSIATPAQISALNAVKSKRSAWRFLYDSAVTMPWQIHVDWRWWSDDYIVPHYHPVGIESNDLRINRTVTLSRTFRRWQANVQWVDPVTLSLLDYPVSPPVYAWKPRVTLLGAWPSSQHGWFSWFVEATQFKLKDPPAGDMRIRDATRLVLKPKWTWQHDLAHGQMILNAGIHGVMTAHSGQQNSMAVPWLTLHQQWWLPVSWGGAFGPPNSGKNRWSWTMMPALMFHVAPHVAQSKLPLLDTSDVGLDMLSMSDDRRFLGQDRYGDAHDMTLSWTNRWQHNRTTTSWKVARRLMLRPQHICLTPTCNTSQPIALKHLTYMRFQSDVSPGFSWMTSGYMADGSHRWPWYSGDVRWTGHRNRVLLGYRHQRILSGTSVKGEAWWVAKLRHRWPNHWWLHAGMAVIDPNEKNDRYVHLGVGQQSCCWSWSVDWTSFLRRSEQLSLKSRDTRLGFKISLTGIGSVGKV